MCGSHGDDARLVAQYVVATLPLITQDFECIAFLNLLEKVLDDCVVVAPCGEEV